MYQLVMKLCLLNSIPALSVICSEGRARDGGRVTVAIGSGVRDPRVSPCCGYDWPGEFPPNPPPTPFHSFNHLLDSQCLKFPRHTSLESQPISEMRLRRLSLSSASRPAAEVVSTTSPALAVSFVFLDQHPKTSGLTRIPDSGILQRCRTTSSMASPYMRVHPRSDRPLSGRCIPSFSRSSWVSIALYSCSNYAK